jgi:AraC-like DNA-binding protein
MPDTPHPTEDPVFSHARAALARQLTRLTPGGGLHLPPALPDLMLFRSDRLDGNVCAVYEPCVALIVQGKKRVVVGGDTLVYDESRYFVTSLEVPAVATLLEASPERPYLALVLKLDLRQIASLVLGGEVPPATGPQHEGRAMATGAVTPPLLDACSRLLDLLDRPEDIPVLGPLVQREILYRLLTGEVGTRLRQVAAVGSQGQQVARAIAWLKQHYAEPLRVEQLAREVRMSVSSFHHHFKAMTALSPLQYQKVLRLAEARRLMLLEHLDAATAAYRVGYESPSQFGREYSRQYGAPPGRDISALRARGDEEARALGS